MGRKDAICVRFRFPGFGIMITLAALKGVGTQPSSRERRKRRIMRSPTTGQSFFHTVVTSLSYPGAEAGGRHTAVQQSAFSGSPT